MFDGKRDGLLAPCARWFRAIRMLSLVCAFTATAQAAPVEQSVTFASTDDTVELTGTLIRPTPTASRARLAAVVLQHGCAGVRPKTRQAAHDFATRGYVALIVDSFSARGVKRVCGRPRLVGPLKRASDAYAAKAYLSRLSYVDPDRIGLIGWSHGGWSALVAASGAQIPVGVTAFSGVVAYYPWCPDSLVGHASPILILIGADDDWTPASRCEAMRTSSQPEVVVNVYPGAVHAFDAAFSVREYQGHAVGGHPEAAASAKRAMFDFLEAAL